MAQTPYECLTLYYLQDLGQPRIAELLQIHQTTVSQHILYALKKLRQVLCAEPVTTTSLMEDAGCSYPTVANVLERLGEEIERHAYKKVKLGRFPKEAWTQLLAVSDRARATVRFVDASGQPRSPDSLIRRLNKLDNTGIAIGGPPGARYWYPELDLVGTPRLDLSVHCPRNRLDITFIHSLDPALKNIENRNQPASLVVHAVRRKSQMFEQGKSGAASWADPVECLMDLYEMHLQKQVNEFIKAAPPLSEEFRLSSSSDEDIPVWPDPEGNQRGYEFKPLCRSVPLAARNDARLYEWLVLADALRGGRAREREIASAIVRKRLQDEIRN